MQKLNDLPEGKQIIAPFLRLPSKKAFPDYYQLIQRPISVSEIKGHNNKSDYSSLQSLYDDFRLLRDNALQYNEQGSDIANAANLILRTVEDYILQITSPNNDVTAVDRYMIELEKSEVRIMDELARYKQGRSRLVAELFIDEPSREDYPDYYNIISNPTSINTIKNQITYGRARTISAFKSIVQLMFDNALKANEENSQVVADARSLEKAFQLRVDKLIKSLPAEPHGYSKNAESIMEGQCPIQKSPDETTTSIKSITPLKLRIKAPVAQAPKEPTRLKLSLKTSTKPIQPPKVLEDVPEPIFNEDTKEVASPETVKNSSLEYLGAPNGVEISTDAEDAVNTEDAAEQPMSKVKIEKEAGLSRIEEVLDASEAQNILRDPLQNPSETLIKSVTVSSVIPITSKYHLQKSPPPPALLNLFQITVPASQKYAVQSYSFSVSAFHRTININATINETLNNLYYILTLSHNYRQVNPYSSSTSSPWADANTPITHKYEVNLATGLNFVEITVNTQQGKGIRHASAAATVTPFSEEEQNEKTDKIEKISFWITRSKS